MPDARETIVTAILELRRGDWDACTGEVEDGILVITPAMRPSRCCDDELEQSAQATSGAFTWELLRCRHCERLYSVGPKLPPVMMTPLAHALTELYRDYQAAVAAAYRR